MRFFAALLTVLALLSAPTDCFALLFSVAGNKPQAAANYTRWPGLVKVVNQPSRKQLVWCNGNEHLTYQGGWKTLNDTLRDFAKIEAPTRRVVFRPGPMIAKKKTIKAKFDWQLHIVDGIARAHMKQTKTDLVYDMEPTLTVYVSNKIDLDGIKIPPGLNIEGLGDLRGRYLSALLDGNKSLQVEAQKRLAELDKDLIRKEIGRQKYESSIDAIRRFVRCARRRSARKRSAGH